MIELRTVSVVFRGTTYTVSELTGRQMQSVRELLDKDAEKYRVQSFVAYVATKSPSFKDEADAGEAPQALLAKIFSAAMDLSKDEAIDPKGLTAQQLFEHRLASLLGLTIDQLLSLPARELDRWWAYWQEERWGPTRDNYHAALIIRNLLVPHMAKGKLPPPVSTWMVETREEIRAREEAEALSLQAYLRSAARREKRKAEGKAKRKR